MSADDTHIDHMPHKEKEKVGTAVFWLCCFLTLSFLCVYIFAYAIPESKAERQHAEKVATQQSEYLDDKFNNSIFNMMYRGVLNEKIV